MSALRSLAIAALCIAVLTTPAIAQEHDPHTLGVFGDAEATLVMQTGIAPNVPFEVHAIAFGVDGGVRAYEVKVVVPDGLFVLETSYKGVLNAANEKGEFIIGTGQCLEGGDRIDLVSMKMLSTLAVSDVSICVEGTTPSTFEGQPGYVRCDNGLQPLALTPALDDRHGEGCLVLNPTEASGSR